MPNGKTPAEPRTLVERAQRDGNTEAYTSEQLIERCRVICGCADRHPTCDCVSIYNMAGAALWTEYNEEKRRT